MSTVDVLVPCYNYARFLERAVGSVLSQRGVDVRVLIIDDTSTESDNARLGRIDDRIEHVNSDLRRYLSEHTKTDAADAYVLGAIPLFGGIPADPVFVPNAEQHALQRLTRQRERLEDEVTAIKRRLLDLIRWACPLPGQEPTCFSEAGRARDLLAGSITTSPRRPS